MKVLVLFYGEPPGVQTISVSSIPLHLQVVEY